ncbi:hypothetical protein DPMN_117287 [Dreissena polymorpha]|uniref:Uncharacterized protein n=1 Tax=Dreissena polymorpha TaxID=45954 RepID=A0A9D4KQ38_DREPO|nr:hypothetical protein DPMN_117287 [Dreissena polymorpha]
MEQKTNAYVKKMIATQEIPPGDRSTTKVGLVYTRHQTRLSVQDCSPGHARLWSLSRPSEEKLDLHGERVDVRLHGLDTLSSIH